MLRFLLKKTIFEEIIGDMFFHPDNVDSVTQQRALRIFKMLSDDDDADESEAATRDQYIVQVKTVKLITLGDSFRSVCRQFQVIRGESGIAEYNGSSDVSISNYVRLVCAASLQKLDDPLQKCWAYSIGFDC